MKRLFSTIIPLLLVLTLIVGITPENRNSKNTIPTAKSMTNQEIKTDAALASKAPQTAEANTVPEAAKANDAPNTALKAESAASKAAASKASAPSTPAAPSRAPETTKVSRQQSDKAPAPAPTPTPTPAPAKPGSKASAIISTAKEYIGVKYVWGGTTPNGFDCSGFTQYVFAKHGVTLPRISRDQYNSGKAVNYSSLQPGDLVFFSLDGDKVTDHVGIFIGSGQFIHASSSKGVTISSLSSYWQSKYLGAKRVL